MLSYNVQDLCGGNYSMLQQGMICVPVLNACFFRVDNGFNPISQCYSDFWVPSSGLNVHV